MASKRSRASGEQLNAMVDFMTQNPVFAGGKFAKLHGKQENEQKWAELSDNLNGLGGAFKTIDQWQKVWADLKSRTSVKVRERKKQMALTGNHPLSEEPVTELEKRVISLIGKCYIEGHDEVKENVPAEEALQLRMEDGEDICLHIPPSEFEATLEYKCETPFATPTTAKKTPRSRMPKKALENDIQKQFLDIANKHAESLKILAECAAANAENGKVMADAIKTLGTGLNAVADAFKSCFCSLAFNMSHWKFNIRKI